MKGRGKEKDWGKRRKTGKKGGWKERKGRKALIISEKVKITLLASKEVGFFMESLNIQAQ